VKCPAKLLEQGRTDDAKIFNLVTPKLTLADTGTFR
jgi:hypothetical protein